MNHRLFSKVLLLASLWLSGMAAVTTFTACSDSNDDEPGSVNTENAGITNPSWNGEVLLGAQGQTYNLSFTAAADWTIENQSDWLVLSTLSGKAGNAVVMVTAKANNTESDRDAAIVIRVKGYQQTTVKFSQPVSEGEEATGVNAWVRNYMTSHYLWNEPIPTLKISNSLTAAQYLDAILKV